MKITGQDRVIRNLAQYATRLSFAMDAAVLESAETVKETSQALCPVATGALRESAVTAAEVQSDVVTAAVGYTASYALAVHEKTEIRHTNGQAKFLEDAVKQYEPKYLFDLGKAAEKVRI